MSASRSHERTMPDLILRQASPGAVPVVQLPHEHAERVHVHRLARDAVRHQLRRDVGDLQPSQPSGQILRLVLRAEGAVKPVQLRNNTQA